MASHSYSFGQKVRFLVESAGNGYRADRNACPSCGSHETEVIARKYVVCALRRCARCSLLFRAPTTSAASLASFHASRYRQGTVTDIPSADEIERLKERRFRDSFMDYSGYIKVLKALPLPAGAKVLELGCSWGYGCWQIREEGFAVMGCEVSSERAGFARDRMGIETRVPEEIDADSCDIFFSSHVLEHIPDFARVRQLAWKALRKGGYFVSINPNGCLARRAVEPRGWASAWGFIHPLLFDDVFFRKEFGSDVRHLGTEWRQASQDELAAAITAGRDGRLDGSELVTVILKG